MRLIDADALLDGREDHEMISTHLIWNAPTIEAEPVQHGSWIPIQFLAGTKLPTTGFECSNCRTILTWGTIYRYCPHCGAKMDGERRTDETN